LYSIGDEPAGKGTGNPVAEIFAIAKFFDKPQHAMSRAVPGQRKQYQKRLTVTPLALTEGGTNGSGGDQMPLVLPRHDQQ
jgi:hypothetical protein